MVIDVLADVWAAVIDLEYAVGISCDFDVLTALWNVGIPCDVDSAVTIIGVATDIGVDVLAGVNVKGLVAVVTALEVTLTAP